VLLATNETSLLAIIGRANTDSINMMAEALCKRLGYDATGRGGTWQSGTAAVEAYARSLGVPAGLVDLQDGSGMSARDRVAAEAFTTVLAHIAQRADGQTFLDTLAVPGEGTLRRRFAGSPLADRVRAKTGHISGVSCLAGILTVPQAGGASRRFAFAILCNGYKGNVNGWQEKVVAAVDAWAGE
jgi:D-alanyl-D-alanine carboxypeptidase/D-alanyl-D-alanine-endopeptidase (penicillin-binding protein 4)